jgi:hypothetical protein
MRWSLVLLAVGIALLAFGFYWVAFAVNEDLAYQRNFAACTTAPWCGGPPPSMWAFVSATAPFIFIGPLVVIFGIVQLRNERRGRSVTSTA